MEMAFGFDTYCIGFCAFLQTMTLYPLDRSDDKRLW